MSRKRAHPTPTRAAQRRAEAARAAEAAAAQATRSAAGSAGLRRNRPRWLIGGLVAAVAAILVLAVAYVASGGGARPVASTAPSSAASPAGGPSIAVGGPLAEKLVAALHSDPFRAHIDETTVARSTAGTVTVTLTAKAVGDVSGRDVNLHVSSTGAGPAVDQEVVSVGDTTWIRRTGGTTWEVHRRAEAASAIDGLLSTIRLLDDPTQLSDAGIETVDGQALHRLTAAGSIAYRSPDGADGAYDRLDIWATDAGLPVLVRGSFSAAQGENSIIGNVTIRYANIGTTRSIAPPSGAPSAIP